jgi:ribosome biogenesis protein ENP2
MKFLKFKKNLKRKKLKEKEIFTEKNDPIDVNFRFPSTVNLIKESPNSRFLIAYGNYPPQIKCFDLEDLSLKFQRNLESSILDFHFLNDDWEKLVFLRSDKLLEFHIKSGRYYQIKLNKAAVDLSYVIKQSTLFVTSIKQEILRLDLENGKFLSPLKNLSKFNNTCSANNPSNNIIAFGNSGGVIKFWDPRIVKKSIFKIESFLFSKNRTLNSITTLRFGEKNEYSLCSGLNSGEFMEFDLRNAKPLIIKKLGNNLPIKSIRFSESDNQILISDKKSIKIWKKNFKKDILFFNSIHEINHICKIKKTGFLFIALEYPLIEGKFISCMGRLPSWCSVANFNKFSQKKNL